MRHGLRGTTQRATALTNIRCLTNESNIFLGVIVCTVCHVKALRAAYSKLCILYTHLHITFTIQTKLYNLQARRPFREMSNHGYSLVTTDNDTMQASWIAVQPSGPPGKPN